MFERLFAFALCIFFAGAIRQEITFYSERNFEGIAVVIRSPMATLGDYGPVLKNAKSFCISGWWLGYEFLNFDGFVTSQAWTNGSRTCEDRNPFSRMYSLRYYGPNDTSISAITLFNGAPYGFYAGEGKIITAVAASNFGFIPTGILLTGTSSWTGFSNEDFTGNATCFTSTSDLERIALVDSPVLSVVKGCNHERVDEYVELANIPA